MRRSPGSGGAPPTASGGPPPRKASDRRRRAGALGAGAALAAAALLLLTAPAAGMQDAAASQDAPADSSELDARTARVADQLRCPICRSQSVLESSSTLAREMKAEIRRRLAEGQTPEEVKAYFVSRYGEWVLLRPEARGLNLLVYVLPPLLLVGGGLLVWALLRRWSPRAGSDAGSPAGPAGPTATDAGSLPGDGLSEEEERRLEEAMRERT